MPRCPGQDMRYWTAKDIFDVSCPYCDNSIEFWKDEPFRLCRVCRKEVRNPRIDLGCAKWCKFGSQCLGHSADEQLASAPVIEKLKAQLQTQTEGQPARYGMAMENYRIANLLLTSEGGDPCRKDQDGRQPSDDGSHNVHAGGNSDEAAEDVVSAGPAPRAASVRRVT